MINAKIRQTLDHLDQVRKFWSLTNDPGPGEHALPEGYLLRIVEREEKKKTVRVYTITTDSDRHDPITLSYDWKRFSENLSKRDGKDFFMAKLSIHDEDLREKIKLKCKNDWNYDLTEDQISMCIIEMEEQRLSLFHNQLWPNQRQWKDKKTDQWMKRITWDKTIDGYRAIAHRSGRFAGVDAAVFDVDEDNNLIARITVYALDATGQKRSYVGEARFDEFVQLIDEYEGSGKNRKKTGNRVPNSQWSESPRNQISIAAERQALRKAFQDLADEPKEFICEPEPLLEQPRLDQAPEPDLEGSRGIPTPPPTPTEQRAKKKEASKKDRKEPTYDGGPRDPYVGIPKGGFQAFKKYNADERIIMTRYKGNLHYLALDSGFKVAINQDGYEVERSRRSDKTKGGIKWEKGDTYFDGSTVEAIANHKKDEWSLWLALNNGFKVLLDRWGKESKRKERKAKAPVASEPVASAPADAQDISRPDIAVDQDSGPIDIESIETIEMMRKVTAPLLKRWFKKIDRTLSPKGAYGELTGVILTKGQAMNLDDYKVLYGCLEDAINLESEEN